MDKTTTWLVRGAAIVVISFGVITLSSALKYQINQSNLNKEEKEKIAIKKGEKRCEKLPILYGIDFMKMLKNNEIKKGFYSPSYIQVNTTKGKYIVRYVNSFSLLMSEKNIPVYFGKTLTETYNKICR